MGDRKPSQVLRKMQQLLAGNNIDPSILEELFFRKLPLHVQKILSLLIDTTLEKKGVIADKIMEVSLPTLSPTSKNALEMNVISKEISELLNILISPRNNCISTNKHKHHVNSNMCWYNFNFGPAV